MDVEKKLLRLDSMTLRGIGSYFNGAELKIRPLTILCGTNGSGKSTWFNVLSMLKRSIEKDMLPFRLDARDRYCHDMELTNSRVNGAEIRDLAEVEEQNDRFGPYGTIGLSGEATEAGALFPPPSEGFHPASHAATSLLWEGKIEKGAKLRVRIAHSSDGMVEYRKDFVELCLNDKQYIRFTMPDMMTDRRDRIDYPYELSCSRSFYDGDEENHEVIDIALIQCGGAGFDLSKLEDSDEKKNEGEDDDDDDVISFLRWRDFEPVCRCC